MNNCAAVTALINERIIPDDAEVLTSSSNLILRSQSGRLVARVAAVEAIRQREDPGDIGYSHWLSWQMAEAGLPVLRPLTRDEIRHQNLVVSLFPLANNVDLASHDPADVYEKLKAFSTFNADDLRRMNVLDYTRQRLEYVRGRGRHSRKAAYTALSDIVEQHAGTYDFDSGQGVMIHGDLHSQNIVDFNGLKFIDLDTAAIGPKLYDLGSWKLRHTMFDKSANVDGILAVARRDVDGWDEDLFRAMIGWKAISSLSYILRNGPKEDIDERMNVVGAAARSLGALAWKTIQS